MTANRAWIERNLGFDPIKVKPPRSTFALKAAAMPRAQSEDLRREILILIRKT